MSLTLKSESERRWAEMNPVDISWGLLELVIDRWRIFASCVQFYRVEPEISMIKWFQGDRRLK